MHSTSDQRYFRRYQYDESPLFIEIPDLCEVLIEPEDISWGGFEVPEHHIGTLGIKVILPGTLRPPRPGMRVNCNLEILNEVFEGLIARIPWSADTDGGDAGCSIGMHVEVPEERRDRFVPVMKRTFSYLRPAQNNQGRENI